MSSIGILLAALSLGPAASVPRPDEGIRFSCERQQLPGIEAAMATFLTSLGIPDGLVIRKERRRQGVVLYTLATPAQDTSTLDFSTRSEMDLSSDTVTLPLGEAGASPIATVSQKEILLALLQHGRLTELRGTACSVEALADHVALRQNIVAWSERLRWGWPNGGPAEWNKSYWNRGTPKAGVSLRAAIDDVFTNQSAYAIGCYTATKLVVVKGVLDYYGRVRGSDGLFQAIEGRLLSDGEPLVDVEPARAWSFEPGVDRTDARPGKLLSIIHNVSPKNFVPGDWVYFLNTDPASSRKVGYEGSNAVYLGGGRFDDYYGDNNHAFRYQEKLDEVFQWRHGVFSRARDAEKRHPLTERDFDRLGYSPSRGGLVKAWRMAPSFFPRPTPAGPQARRTVRSHATPIRLKPTHLSALRPQLFGAPAVTANVAYGTSEHHLASAGI
jgi:hypothetical protein